MLWTRMLSQGMVGSRMVRPVDVVEWMGALQGQDIRSVRWAVGMRMAEPSLRAVREALDSAQIVRIHVMRPTWHYIPGKDFRWMAALSQKSFMAACTSYARQAGVSGDDYRIHRKKFEKILEGRHLTRQEICEQLGNPDETYHDRMVWLCLSFAEAEGLICSGIPQGDKHTYALAGERIPNPVELSREESLAELARRYFRSHAPATMEDFIWWSGLGVRDARSAVMSLGKEILTEVRDGRGLMVHESSPTLSTSPETKADKVLRFLPPFDEYLISYKNRFDCIREDHSKLAYNNFGIFQPVILHNGRITGNWRRKGKKETIETTFFPGCRPAAKTLIDKASKDFFRFMNS